MSLGRVGVRLQIGSQTVVDVPPMLRCGVSWVEAERFHGVDGGKPALHLGPAVEAQQDFAAGADEWQCLERLAAPDGPHNVDAGNDRAMLAIRPSDEGEDAARREPDDAAAAVDDLFIALAAEPDPMLDAAFLESQLDQCGEGRRPVRQRTAVRAAMGATGHCASPAMCWWGCARALRQPRASWLAVPGRTGTTLRL